MEKNLINEKIELIIIIIPNNNDKLIDLIINDFKSENEETRKSFEDALIRMCNIWTNNIVTLLFFHSKINFCIRKYWRLCTWYL